MKTSAGEKRLNHSPAVDAGPPGTCAAFGRKRNEMVPPPHKKQVRFIPRGGTGQDSASENTNGQTYIKQKAQSGGRNHKRKNSQGNKKEMTGYY
ncbi:hypothetical protein NDU88_002620 [Pleurodeles waltl]|uniref:Uncharacterized protein n=1 Tax=Pleurodeles waltl TaxID=8319 RepID=A0AAV7KT57_PLEWA|nr:hypothetical protein NDU88_002620 [Pleurodeles waltl]